ncbi:MAG: GDSL-type esterase/lipase family protein [Candidatus Puniceispirillaceae bacterium]
MRILIYGDSNSWGYLDDGSGARHSDRWPVVMARGLASKGAAVELIEECLPGRTSNADDPLEGAVFNGATPLAAILLSHQPLDHILIMLGTNDMKARFGRDAAAITAGIMSLVDICSATPCGPGGWSADAAAPATVICPPALGARAEDPAWERYAEWRGGRATSRQLPVLLEEACAAAGAGFIDANSHTVSSQIDPIHWTADAHRAFGTAMAIEMMTVS